MTFISNPGLGSGNPVFDYSSRDYSAIYSDLLNRIPVYLPEWTSRSNNDFGIALLQMFAYTADLLHYYMDRIAGEAFLQTATQPASIINIAAMLDYTPALSSGAVVELSITIATGMLNSSYPVVIPAGSIFSTVPSGSSTAIPFVTTTVLSIPGPTSATPSYTGTVEAQQGTQYSQDVATSDGTINQAYILSYSPVSAGSLTVEVNLGPGFQAWAFVESLIDSGPTDYVYTDWVDANGNFYIVFGDGVNGYIPPLGSPVEATYMTNVGSQGNVGPNTVTVFGGPPAGGSPIIGISAVTNPLAASGGANAESISSIQQNAPLSLRALNRGVTEADIAALAQGLSGVQWASVIEATYQLVNLYIAPSGGGTVSALLASQITTAMEMVTMANTTVTVFTANYIAIDITVAATVFANFSDSSVQQAIEAALNNLFLLTDTGFGYRVSLGLVYETVLAVPGVNYAFVTQLTREVFVALLSGLTSGNTYTALNISDLPQQANAGDQLILNNGTNQQTVTLTQPATSGSNAISVGSFVANANYPAGTTTLKDTTLLADAVLLEDEIPVAGVMNVTASGGIPT